MSGEAIYLALTRGVMKTQADGLSSAQIFALLGYIAPTGGARAAAPQLTPTCGTQPAFSVSANTPEWNGWSTKITNSRFQDAASAGLTAADLGRLKLKWAFNLGDVTEARSQPAVFGRYVFIGATTGALYALDADSGCTLWGFSAASAIRGGVAIGDAAGTPAVFFSDTSANVYALNAQTGKLIWKVRPVDHFATLATATPRYYNGVLYQAFSSFEETVGGDPKYQCCTFRGSVVALNAANGDKLWQTFTIPDPASAHAHESRGHASNTAPREPASGRPRPLMSNWALSTLPPETTIRTLRPGRATPFLPWISKPANSSGQLNSPATTPSTARAPCPYPVIALRRTVLTHDFGQPPILLNLRCWQTSLGDRTKVRHGVCPRSRRKRQNALADAGRQRRAIRRQPVGFGVGWGKGLCGYLRSCTGRSAGSEID